MDPIYDDPAFFAQYTQMPRSKEGLSAAGEWHQLRALFPPLAGKNVLDLGCGYGWHCRYAAGQGAAQVLGIDASTRMIAGAHARGGENSGAAPVPVTRKNPAPKACAHGGETQNIAYRVCGIEEYEYPENTWDCVLSNLALHYLADLDTVFSNVYRTLVPGGIFLFNIEHPVFTAGVGQDWIYDADGAPLYWPVDDYYRPGARTTHFLGCEVTKQHHTLTQIVQGLLQQGFRLTALEEAQPPEEMMHLPGMADELRRPMMLLVRAEKEVASDEKNRDR